jgi:hypothetical protein
MARSLVALSFVVFAAACTQPGTQSAAEVAESQTATMTLPAGNAADGRQAFLDLKCTACHSVPSETGFPAPVTMKPAPPIDARLGGRDVSYLLTALVSPSHELSPDIGEDVRAQLSGSLSPMGDFSRVMTVRQLVDLHAFIRSLR